MGRTRRRFLVGGVLATAVTAGCLDGGDDDGGNGDGRVDPMGPLVEQPRLDEPPYTIVEQSDDADEWNDLYLCEHMWQGSDLEFDAVSAPRLADPLLPSEHQQGDEYAVRVLESAEAVHEVFETGASDAATETTTATGTPTATEIATETSGDDGPTPTGGADDTTPDPGGSGDGTSDTDGEDETPIAETDFEEHVLLVVESGYVSGSLTHHWERVERTERGFRLHGCYEVPYERTSDVDSRHSVVRVERPDAFEFARVSLTTAEDERVHFNSTEGVVAVVKDV